MDAVTIQAVHFLFFILSNIFIEAFILHVRNTFQRVNMSQTIENKTWVKMLFFYILVLLLLGHRIADFGGFAKTN